MSDDKQFIRRCNELALESYKNGDLPFGALITKDDKILAEGYNTGLVDITGHAEINVLRKVIQDMPEIDITKCTLYTNFEPCAMCSYIIRDYGVSKVVYSVASPHLGGHSKWGVLTDYIQPKFTSRKNLKPPEIISGVLEAECSRIFDKLGWEMHHYT